jgi:uncharacterized membrane protein
MKQPVEEKEKGDSRDTGRTEAFSDGVFAVAITLLVLDIRLPTKEVTSTEALFVEFLQIWPILLAFVSGFATIGIMWINHHRLFTHIVRTDNWLLVLNLLLLLVIIFIPFPTALLAEYLPEPEQKFPALLYSATSVVMSICFNLLWRYAAKNNRLLDSRADLGSVKAISDQYRFGPLLYLVAFGLAFFNVALSVGLNLLLAAFFALPGKTVLLREKPELPR